jgi:hypothetical protein
MKKVIKKKKTFLAIARIMNSKPGFYYVFFVVAENEDEAREKARSITENDYGFCYYVGVYRVKTLKDVKKMLGVY